MIGKSKQEGVKYGRVRNASMNAAPLRAALILLIGAVALRVGLTGVIQKQQTHACQMARDIIALQEINYEHRYHHFIVGDEDALQELVRARMARWIPQCRAGGHYAAIVNEDGSITIQCSLPEHNAGGGTTRRRYQKRRY